MAEYLHGIEMVEISDGSRPIQVKKAGVIGVVGTAGKGPVNTPVLISGSPRKAAETFGAYNGFDVDGFSLPEAFDGIFDQGGATIVAINVCDPLVHTADVVAEVFTLDAAGVGKTAKPFISALAFTVNAITVTKKLSGDQMALPAGITITSVEDEEGGTTYVDTTDYTFTAGVLTREENGDIAANQSLFITYETTVVAGDYTVDLDTGRVIMSQEKVEPKSTLAVDYTHVDPSAVTEADVMGGVQGDGSYTGSHALKGAAVDLGVTPRILIAPRFTHTKEDSLTANPVVAEMLGFADRLRGMVYADAPSTTDADAVAYRNDWSSKRVMVLDPFVKVLSPSGEYVYQPRSARRAGLAAKVINDHGFHVLPSNRPLFGIVGTQRPIESGTFDKNSASNYLNENEVSTLIRMEGFREWGGRTAATDPKWAFESVVRTADMIQEAILLSHLWAVDRNITRNLVGSILESVNAYLRQLKARDVILGGTAWVDPELNTAETVSNGELYIDFDFTPTYPAEHIIFRSHLVNNYIEEIFVGGDFATSGSGQV